MHVKISKLAKINAASIDEVLSDPPRSGPRKEGNTTFYLPTRGHTETKSHKSYLRPSSGQQFVAKLMQIRLTGIKSRFASGLKIPRNY